MKVHPIPSEKNSTFNYNISSSHSECNRLMAGQNKLRRLPHMFARVLQLPFRSDADVYVEETPNCLRFIASIDEFMGDDIRAHTIEIHPGATKIVVTNNNVIELSLDDLELDMWRFRLPPSTRPELANAVYVNGELIITIPKTTEFTENSNGKEYNEVWEDGNGGDFRGRVGNFLSCTILSWLRIWRTRHKHK